MSLMEFVQKGWADHAEDEEGVFARLPEGLGLVTEAAHIPPLAALTVHVGGEHLGRWDDALGLLDRMGDNELLEAGSAEDKALRRSMAILHLGAGRQEAFEECLAQGATGGDVPAASDRIRVLAVASSALAAQKRTDEAIARFEEALSLAEYGPVKGDPAAQALAITGNNLACELEEVGERSDAETRLMKTAAETGRRFWEIAGTWTNVERAEYRLAMTHLAAGDAAQALIHAGLCLAVCEENAADAGERFFAHEALAKAQHASGDADAATASRSSAATCLDEIEDEGFRGYCAGELSKLDAVLSA
jgi:tetratricopeptide (TPR) repeat protein